MDGQKEAVECLLKVSADPIVYDCQGRSAKDYCYIKRGDEDEDEYIKEFILNAYKNLPIKVIKAEVEPIRISSPQSQGKSFFGLFNLLRNKSHFKITKTWKIVFYIMDIDRIG